MAATGGSRAPSWAPCSAEPSLDTRKPDTREAVTADLKSEFMRLADLTGAARREGIEALRRSSPELARSVERLLEVDRADELALDRAESAPLTGLLQDALPGLISRGRRIGPYQVDDLIGAGGMGRVYSARRIDDGIAQRVAIKLVRPDCMASSLLERFSSERQHLAALNHPGICRFLDAGQMEDGTPFVVMELVEGVDLLEYADRQQLDLTARIELFRQVLAAVEHAHRQLVVHRDIKSGNVLVDAEGHAKLLDFGIAKHLDRGAGTHTSTHERLFSPSNAAPEQILGLPVSVACDIYALGSLLFELITGQAAFDLEGLSGAEFEKSVLSRPPRTPSAIARKTHRPWATRVTRDLDAIILQCLRKAPEERYRQVSDLAEDLDRFLQYRPVRARPSGALYRFRLFALRHPAGLGMAGLLAATLATSLWVISAQNVELRIQRDAAETRSAQAEQAIRLLEGAFLAADPTGLQGEQLSARQILDSAKQKLAELETTQPQAYARLASTIASIELNGLSETEAARWADRALEASATTDHRDDSLDRLHLLAARARLATGDLDLAHTHLQRVPASVVDSSAEWQALNARLHRLQYENTEAEASARRALAMRSETVDMAEVLASETLALTLAHIGRIDEGIEVLEALHARQHAALGPSHPQVHSTELEILRLRARAGDTESALAGIEALEAEIQRAFGESSPMQGYVQASRAVILSGSQRMEEAVALYRAAYQNWQRTLGRGHVRTLRLGFNLAQALRKRDRSGVEARELLQALVNEAESTLSPGRSLVNYFRISLISWYLEDALPARALSVLTSPHALASTTDSSASNLTRLLELGKSVNAAVCASAPLPDCTRLQALMRNLDPGETHTARPPTSP